LNARPSRGNVFSWANYGLRSCCKSFRSGTNSKIQFAGSVCIGFSGLIHRKIWCVCRGYKRRQGSITKAGNSFARKLLVESAWSDRHPARVSPDIQRRHEGIPKAIIDRAWDAQLRLCRRYRALIARGKSAQVAIVAIARELAAYVWDIGRMGIVLAAQHNAQSI